MPPTLEKLKRHIALGFSVRTHKWTLVGYFKYPKFLVFSCVCFSLLASGSDDVQVLLWDPFRKRKVTNIRTGHQGNIFSIKVSSCIWNTCADPEGGIGGQDPP